MRPRNFHPLAICMAIAFTGHCISEATAQRPLNIRDLSSNTPSNENKRLSPDKETMLNLVLEQGTSRLGSDSATGWKYPETYIAAVLSHAYSVDMSRQADRDCAGGLIGNAASLLQLHYRERSNYPAQEYIEKAIREARNGPCANSPAAYEGALAMLEDIGAAYENEAAQKRGAEETRRQEALAAMAAREQRDSSEIRPNAAAGEAESAAKRSFIDRLQKQIASLPTLPETHPLAAIYSRGMLPVSHMAASAGDPDFRRDVQVIVDGMQGVDLKCRQHRPTGIAIVNNITHAWQRHVFTVYQKEGMSQSRRTRQPSAENYSSLEVRCSPTDIGHLRTFVAEVDDAMGKSVAVVVQKMAGDEERRIARQLEEKKAKELHIQQIKSGAKPVANYSDAITLHNSQDGARDVINPAVNPSGNLIHLQVRVDRVDGSFLVGTYGSHVVGIRISGKTQIIDEKEMRIGRSVGVVGRYSTNTENLLGRTIPVIDAIFIESF